MLQTDVKCLTATGGPATDCICPIPEDDGPCHETKCQAEGKDGLCYLPHQSPPQHLNLRRTDIKCNSAIGGPASECVCWIPEDGPCSDTTCQAEGKDGQCFGPNQVPLPELNLKQTDIKCDSATDCICWIPKDGSVDCKDNWKTSRCEEEKEKGKCKKNKQIRKKCKKTCDLCPITIGN